LKIEFDLIYKSQQELLSYLQIISRDGIYLCHKDSSLVYVVSDKTIFEYNCVANKLSAWNIYKIPATISSNKPAYVRAPNGYKFSLRFTQT
jgi:hypothetical protein